MVSLERKQAEQIIQAVGGATNIERVIHCVTRLRFYLVDPSKVDSPRLVAIDGVAGEAFNALLGQYQVVIGLVSMRCMKWWRTSYRTRHGSWMRNRAQAVFGNASSSG